MPKSVFSDAYKELLALLVESRKSAGLTQTELAERLNRPQPFVSYYERGERRVDVVEFITIARAIGVLPDNLFQRLLSQVPEDTTI